MRANRIRLAMDAGKGWAEDQLEHGIEITAASAEEVAKKKFSHLGMQYLFVSSALDRLLQEEARSGARPQNAA